MIIAVFFLVCMLLFVLCATFIEPMQPKPKISDKDVQEAIKAAERKRLKAMFNKLEKTI